MRFRFAEEHCAEFSTARLCEVLNFSSRGLRAFRSRPASRRQRSDLITLAHISRQDPQTQGDH
ncbi:Integrase core domain protein [Sulfitobacter donghicola DSW-25 = KCTC 12864 = JCM 14565]|nr:Integrase core domain protein [Sulfitobacter donghicola DSW-25 = KCTC 12864 = JCM 14565]